MDPEQLKQRAIEFLQAVSISDVDTLDRLTNEDFHAEFMAKSSGLVDGVAARRGKDSFLNEGIPSAKVLTKDGMGYTYELIVCEAPYVVVFGESHATAYNDKHYNNCYSWRFKFSGDKVSELQEYCDTHLAMETFS